MVKLIIKDTRDTPTKNLIEGHFKPTETSTKNIGFIIHTQKRLSLEKNTYYIHNTWTLKIEKDKIFIISDHISSVIDLTVEAPVMIETKVE